MLTLATSAARGKGADERLMISRARPRRRVGFGASVADFFFWLENFASARAGLHREAPSSRTRSLGSFVGAQGSILSSCQSLALLN
jgi:hypothetical protein